MAIERSLNDLFADHADRDAHELARLTDEEQRELLEAIDAIEKDKEEKIRSATERQKENHAKDMAAARDKIKAERAVGNTPPGMPRISSPEMLEKLAAREVEAKNRGEIAVIGGTAKEKIKQEITFALGKRIDFQQERASIAQQKTQHAQDKASSQFDLKNRQPPVHGKEDAKADRTSEDIERLRFEQWTKDAQARLQEQQRNARERLQKGHEREQNVAESTGWSEEARRTMLERQEADRETLAQKQREQEASQREDFNRRRLSGYEVPEQEISSHTMQHDRGQEKDRGREGRER